MSHGYTVNIKLSVFIIFPQTELLVNLAVFNLLELAGGADISEYECRRKHSGLPSKHEGLQLACVFPCLPNDLVKRSDITMNRTRDPGKKED